MMKDKAKLTDEELVEAVRSRDKELYAEVIRRYQAKLLRYAGYIMGDEQKGADAVQEGLIKAYVNLKSFNTKRKFSSWIYRIVHNEAMRMLKKDKKLRRMDEGREYESGVNLEDEVIKKEMLKRAHSCLKKMPLIYREPLSLFYLEEKSYEEISDILRIPLGTVGTRINRAKGILKKICQKKTR